MIFLLFFLSAAITSFIAGRKGYHVGACALLSLVPVLGIIIALALPNRNKGVKP